LQETRRWSRPYGWSASVWHPALTNQNSRVSTPLSSVGQTKGACPTPGMSLNFLMDRLRRWLASHLGEADRRPECWLDRR
jgi:hypothetical protein